MDSQPHARATADYRFNPLEVVLRVDQSSPPGTEAIERLIRALEASRRLGLVRYDTSSGAQDCSGKPALVSIELTGTGSTISIAGQTPDDEQLDILIDCDFVIIVDDSDTGTPAILATGAAGGKTSTVDAGMLERVFMCCGEAVTPPAWLPEGIPYCPVDEHEKLQNAFEAFQNERIKQRRLCGLMLSGGRSTRMQHDKSLIDYHGVSQVEYGRQLLSEFCDEVFISNRIGQEEDHGTFGMKQLHDKFLDIGPLGGILTALHSFPECTWLILACDLPFVTKRTVSNLIRHRNPYKMATCYRSDHDGLPEPLCAIYEAKSRFRMFRFLARDCRCPRKIMMLSDVELLQQPERGALDNINTPQEYHEARRRITSCGS